MEYVNLGKTGLKVSRLGLGCMGFGSLTNGGIPGKTNEEDARVIIEHALAKGINYFDTANYYSRGVSEEILGRAIRDFADRDNVVVSTKAYYPMRDDPNAKGLSRKALFTEVDHSLERLGMDYIDLFVPHRWDYTTPIEETMEALNDLVKAGKIRYIGASAMYAWQFVTANRIAKEHGWAQFVSMQDIQNLLYREEEKEMVKMCQYYGIAMTPFSPLAHGVFAKGTDAERTDGVGKLQSEYVLEQDRIILQRTKEIADRYERPMTQIALAWLLSKPYITAPLIGGSKVKYIDDALAALEIRLTEEEISYLEEPYVPHAQYGFR